GYDSDIIATSDLDAVSAAGGNIVLQAGRDVALGTAGANFDNDVRARGSVTVNVGRDFVIDGFSALASDDFAAGAGGNAIINAGRNIHVRNAAGPESSIAAGGSTGADVILTTGQNGGLFLDAPIATAVTSSSGDVIVNADRVLIASGSGISASSGEVMLRPVTIGREMILGTVSNPAGAVGLSDVELNRIFASNLTIGSNNTGNVSVVGSIAPAGTPNITLRSGEDIRVQASVTTTGVLELGAGDNFFHTAGTINAPTLSAQVDLRGNDAGAGGFGGFFSLFGT